MKILVLTSRIPWPLEKGDKLRIYHQIKELSKRHEIILCCLSDQKIHPEAKLKLTEITPNIHFYPLSRAKILFRLFFALFSSRPFQVHYFFQKKIQKKIQQLIDIEKPDHIYCQLIRTSEYVKNIYEIKKTMDYMDAFSKGTQRREHINSGIKKSLLREESKRLQAYENLIFDYFDCHTIISEQDRNCIKHPKKDQIEIISNGIDAEYFSSKPSEKKYDLVFTGNMNYPPNREGALYIIDKIMPIVWKTYPKCKVLIAGANDSSSLKSKANERVIISGWMDDIRDAYNQSKIFIAPMQIGTGLQNKLLEAMSMNLPCITSSLANNALHAEEHIEVLIGSNPKHYAEHILELLENEKMASQIAESGKDFVHRTYNWINTTKKLEKMMIEATS